MSNRRKINIRAPKSRVRAGIVTSKGVYVPSGTLADYGYEVVANNLNEQADIRRVLKSAIGDPSMPTSRIPDQTSAGFKDQNIVKPPDDPELLVEMMERNVTHSACVETKAGDYAFNGWVLKERDGLKDAGVSDADIRAARLEVKRFMECINESMKSMPDLIYDIACDYESTGTCAFEVIRRLDGLIAECNYIPAHTVRVLKNHVTGAKDKAHYVQERFQKTRYFVPFGHNAQFKNKLFRPRYADINEFPAYSQRSTAISFPKTFVSRTVGDELTTNLNEAATELYVITRGPNRRSMSYGTPAARSAHIQMAGEIQAELFNLEFFASKGVPQYAVVFENTFDQEVPATSDGEWDESEAAEEAINEYFAKHLQNADRSVLILHTSNGGKVTFHKLSPETVSKEILEYGDATRESIRLAHRVPPAALGIINGPSIGSGREVAQLMRYRDHIVSPGQRIFAAVVNVIIREGLLIPYFEFEFLPMPVDDEDSRRKHLLAEFEAGALSVNEYRVETKRQPFTSETGTDDLGDALIIRNAQVAVLRTDGSVIQTTMPGDIAGLSTRTPERGAPAEEAA